MHTVADVVRILDTSHSSVRRWTSQFKRHLSDTATPGRGQARAFTDDDLRVLAYVQKRGAMRVPVTVIDQELNTAQLPSLADVVGARGVMAVDDTIMTGLLAAASTGQETQRRIADAMEHIGDAMQLAADVAAMRQEIAELRQRVVVLEYLHTQSGAIASRAHKMGAVDPTTKK